MDHHQRRRRGRQPACSAAASSKMERKIIERNRRNRMKDLHSKLHALLPNYNPREVISLPDQMDEAIKYIKSLETKVKMANEKKQAAAGLRKSGCTPAASSSSIQIHEVGSSLEVALTCGLDNHFIFTEIIRILHEDNVDVVRVNSSMAADNSIMLHVLHAQIPPSLYQLFGTTKVSERLKSFVNESVNDHVETAQPPELFLSGFEFSNDIMWDLPNF